MRIYAMSDIHGCLDVFEMALSAVDLDNPDNRLFLLGDYVPHKAPVDDEDEFVQRCAKCLAFVKALCEKHPEQIVALKGNHEFDLLEDVREGRRSFDRSLVKWMRDLPLFEETEWQIFVHAGIDEEAGDLWHVGTDESILLGKHPATFGRFFKDIVAGHNGTYQIALMAGETIGFNGVLHDGRSHYYIDGSTERSGKIPILRFDTEMGEYAAFLATIDGVTCEGAPYIPMRLDNRDESYGSRDDYDSYDSNRDDDWR